MRKRSVHVALMIATFLPGGFTFARDIDLARATIFIPAQGASIQRQASVVWREETARRTGLGIELAHTWPDVAATIVAVLGRDDIELVPEPWRKGVAAPPQGAAAESFAISSVEHNGRNLVAVVGADARGLLFGVGHLLRKSRFSPEHALYDTSHDGAQRPAIAMRGHQLGYRPKTNSYDAWDVPQWEQYIRDLAVFGTNAIELVPPRTDDDALSPHFPRPPSEMMAAMSEITSRYGLDVWVWYPALDANYDDPQVVERALAEWGAVFEKVPRIDAVFVPGGDPGHTPPATLLNLLEKQTAVLRRWHPKATMWVSPQGFDAAWMREFVDYLSAKKPPWLTGVVFGPQVRVDLPTLREMVPAEYAIRHYPDITHSRQCQYPVPHWDRAFAVTSGRECINPRPVGEQAIFAATQGRAATTGPGAWSAGFITYSEGCNDDVNKIVWSGLGWSPGGERTQDASARLSEVIGDYARYFIGGEVAPAFAVGLFSLERNWHGALSQNPHIEATLREFQAIERAAPPELVRNWRFQMALYRAYYDAYVARRLKYETDLESEALEVLRTAQDEELGQAIDRALSILGAAVTQSADAELRRRVIELGDALHESIQMQLSVPRHGAIFVERGATLDTLDYPLNDRLWLNERLGAARQASPAMMRAAVDEVLRWRDPGPGGFYDDLGYPDAVGRVVWSRTVADSEATGVVIDPGNYRTPRVGFEFDVDNALTVNTKPPEHAWRQSWIDHAEALFDGTLTVRYESLERRARYRLRVVYAGDAPEKPIRLVARTGDGTDIEIHPLMQKPFPVRPVEFDIPAEATAAAKLELRWNGPAGIGRNGRGCQVSELWLLRASEDAK